MSSLGSCLQDCLSLSLHLASLNLNTTAQWKRTQLIIIIIINKINSTKLSATFSPSHIRFLNSLCGQADRPASKLSPHPWSTQSQGLHTGQCHVPRSAESSRHPTGPLRQSVLPAVACKSSRERKQQIKTVPFMMAARRTLIVTQTIYTVAGRSKGTQGRGGGARSVGPAGGGVGGGPSTLEVLQESRHARGTLRARAAAFHF